MLYFVLLTIHIASGSVALLAVLVALITAKGGLNHVRSGRVYALAMTAIFLTALPLACWAPTSSCSSSPQGPWPCSPRWLP